MLRNALSVSVNWQTIKWSSFTKFQVFAWMTLESVGELSEVCSHTVLKCSYLARIGRPDILWSVNKLAQNGPKLVTNDYLV